MAKHKEDQHGACASGIRGEQLLLGAIKNNHLSLLNKVEDFECYYGNEGFGREVWSGYKKIGGGIFAAAARAVGRKGQCFVTDGYCPEINVTFEFKYGRVHGTTEEKVHCDLNKLREGVYPDNLWYIFVGTPEKSTHSAYFKMIVEKENLPCRVIFGMEALNEALRTEEEKYAVKLAS